MSSKVEEALRRSGQNLRFIREQKGYSLAAVAGLSGLKEAMISDMEAGNFDLRMSKVLKVADALNVDIREILIGPAI